MGRRLRGETRRGIAVLYVQGDVDCPSMFYVAETTEGRKDDGFAPFSLAEEAFKEIEMCPPSLFPPTIRRVPCTQIIHCLHA